MTAAAAFVLLAAAWLRLPTPMLLGVVVAFALPLTAVGAPRVHPAWRRRVALVLAAWGFVGLAATYHISVARWDRRGTALRASTEAAGAEALVAAVTREGEALRAAARRALEVPTDQVRAFQSLVATQRPGVDRAVVVAERGVPFAWAGRLPIPLDSIDVSAGLVASPYHLVLVAAESKGNRVAVATAVLHAERPADRLAAALDAEVAETAGVERFLYGPAEDAGAVPEAKVLRVGGRPVLAVRAIAPSVEASRLAVAEWAVPQAALLLGFGILCLLAVAWHRGESAGVRALALATVLGALGIAPLGVLSNVSVVFDPTVYFVRLGGPFTANAAALAITSLLLLLGTWTALRAGEWPRTRLQGLLGVAVVAGFGPFLLRALARGIQVPASGASVPLWIAWEVTLFLAAAAVLLPGVVAGRAFVRGTRGVPGVIAPILAAATALAAPTLLEAPGRLPPAISAVWIVAIVALALARRGRSVVLPVAFVAACGSVTVVWASTVRDRVDLAGADVRALGVADPTVATLLQRYSGSLQRAGAARTRVEVLDGFSRSDLSASDYPVEVTTWDASARPMAELRVRRGPGVTQGVEAFVREVQASRAALLEAVPGDPGVHLVLAAPHDDGTATTVVVTPRSALVPADVFGSFLGFAPLPTPEPPYTLRAAAPDPATRRQTPTEARGRWSRQGDQLHGDWSLAGPTGMRRVHATVDLRDYEAVWMRGALLVGLDLALIGGLWILIVGADGVLRRWWRRRSRDLWRSFRFRLSVALFAACTVPSALFGVWSFRRVQADDARARDLLVRETLRGVAASSTAAELRAAAARFDTPLFLYANGLLVATSDPLLDALAPIGRLLPPEIAWQVAEGDDPTTGRVETLGRGTVRLGYRVAVDGTGIPLVLAAPARFDERLLDRRRNDLAVFLLFALSAGALVALWASGAGARQLSRPIRALRARALAVARGVPVPDGVGRPPVEFQPVFRAFSRMTVDLAESRTALEAAQQRLEATLRHVASGVLVVDAAGVIGFANPRAEAILGVPVLPGDAAARALGPALAAWLTAVQAGGETEAATEVDRDGRRLQARATRLTAGDRRVVITLDDVTDVIRAERVLAWGEMARQVAHEIKNPLTPMRLGMQHLRRARRDGRVDFDAVLEANTSRILTEIDRLDELARTFSRYGVVPVEEPPPVAVDVVAVARDVLELERLGAEGITWVAAWPDGPVWAAARERELREILLNLLENARLAHARAITLAVIARAEGGAELRVVDDGDGIPAALLPRVFEPHFSTRTSGSGLGLAVSRRLVERWGGTIGAESVPGAGATLVLRLPAPPPTG
ncbi:MAG: hypothetical protein RL139_1484 [Gemmatimonadota bacterium]